MSRESTTGAIQVTAAGIGGIEETSVTLTEGINVLVGPNATNRTSFLQAVMAGLGSENVSLKGDREEGFVELEIDGETCTRQLQRVDGEVQFDGEPYLSDPIEADLFAFLLESNEARQAVSTGGELREIILRPVDTAEIEAEIRDLQRERNSLDDRIDRLDRRRQRLPDLEEKTRELDAELETVQDSLAEIRAELAETEDDLETKRDTKAVLESKVTALTDARNRREELEYRLETEREALESTREELAAVESERANLQETADHRIEELDEQLSTLRRQKRTVENQISKLQGIVQFNEEMLDEDGAFGDLFETDTANDPAGKLLVEETRCWTCGSTVAVTEIEAMVEKFRELRSSRQTRRRELEAEIASVSDERDELEAARSRQAELTEEQTALERTIDQREQSLENLETELEEVTETIDELEAEVDRLERVSDSRVLELHKRRNEQELEIERLEADREDVIEEIETLKSYGEEIDDLRERRRQISEQLTDRRTRIERIEREAVDAFNDHIERLLDLLGYDNIERVWIEQTGSDPTAERSYELHIVRRTAEGSSYEDTIDHVSESEREVIGLVFALAGYLVHDVFETVPVMLLDSLEAIDAERIAQLIEYLAEFSPAIVAALLPEDAEALENPDNRVERI